MVSFISKVADIEVIHLRLPRSIVRLWALSPSEKLKSSWLFGTRRVDAVAACSFEEAEIILALSGVERVVSGPKTHSTSSSSFLMPAKSFRQLALAYTTIITKT